VIDTDSVRWGTVTPEIIRPVQSVAAYPLAVLDALPTGARSMAGAEAQAVRTRALIGLAAEAVGLMRGALDNTVQWVKDRQQFGQPIGNFQAVQHRLAECAVLVRACRWLALRAADTASADDAATALLHAQVAMRRVVTDCHQFAGAMGLTLEFPLHLWTYRLKVLQGEAGGPAAQAARLAAERWPAAA
jgi:alkylation response protein AidB-like acyl-CoA dehydrogenase